jgi:hypothetical protein
MTDIDTTPAPETPTAPADAPSPAAEPDTGDATVAEIAAVAAELGITPGQLKGRLEASRKWETRAKKADEDAEAARLAALGDQERAQEEAKLAVQRAEKAEQDLARLKVATAAQLPPELAERLVGSNETEMAEDAARLKALMAPATPPAPGGSADQGPQGPATQEPTTAEAIAAAEAKGDFRTAIALKNRMLAEQTAGT